jgi:hypothetical protein
MLHSEELHNLYTSPTNKLIRMSKLRRMRWVGHVARMGEMRKVFRILVEYFEGKQLIGRPRLLGRIIIK